MAPEHLRKSESRSTIQPPVARLTLQHPPLNVIDVADDG